MFCQNCGAKNEDNSKFCAECGNVINNIGISQPYSDSVNMFSENNSGTSSSYIVPKKKVSPILLVLVIAVFATVIIIILNVVYGTDLSISDVKNGMLYGYSSDTTVGDALDDYFGDGEWESYTIENGSVSVVDYTADATTYDYEDIEITISFAYDESCEDDEFYLQYIGIESYDSGQYKEFYGYDMDSIMHSIYDGSEIEYYWD